MSSMGTLLAVIFLSVIVVNGQLNCSTYNPCGPYGYCSDNADGEWTCQCKFWWDGTYCNQQTDSGKQVIALGCLLGFLIIVFYGLQIARCIRNNRQKPKEKKEKIIKDDPKLIDLAFITARRSARLSSCLTVILTLILTGVAQAALWSIFQPIHNGIVYEYQTNQSLYYIQNSICKVINFHKFNLITFPVACLLILIFMIRTKRASLWREKCYGYGAPVIPVDFLSHVDRTLAAVIFAVCSNELLKILEETLGGSSSSDAGVIVVYLLCIVEVLIMGFRYYPLLAAVYINSIFTLTCATLYAWLDYSITIVDQGMCKADFYPTYDDYLSNSSSSITLMFQYYGTGPNLIAIQLCMNIPSFVCLAYISVKLPMLLVKKNYNRFRNDLSVEARMIMQLTREQQAFFHIVRPNSVEMLYVKNLFRPVDQRPRSQALFARLIPTKIYEWRDDFRFSTRVVCIYSSIALLLYFVAIQAFIHIIPLLAGLEQFCQQLLDAITTLLIATPNTDANGQVNGNTSNFPFPSLVKPFIIGMFLTFIIIIIQLLVLLVNIRRNLFQVFRGDDCELPRRRRSSYVSYSIGNIHFAGYFIGYLIWGFIIIAVFAFILCTCIQAFITFRSVRFLETLLKAIIPGLLFVYFKQYLDNILGQYGFLQENGDVLSINNRRILMIFIYFNFFLDAFLGFISSMFRLILSVLAGIIYMFRLDYSPLGRKLETMDSGFSAYCGFIYTECAHRHPVMLVFVAHLYTQSQMKQLTTENMSFGDRKPVKSSSKYIRKWKLAAFLVRNPTIVFFRKTFLNQLHIDEIHALNDLDNDDKNNIQRRLSIYARRISAAQISIASNSVAEHFQQKKF